jgi:transposase
MQIRFTGFVYEIRMRKRYPSDVTDAQWARIAPLFEEYRRGRPRQVPAREILNRHFLRHEEWLRLARLAA